MKSPIRNVAVNVVLILNLAGLANAAITVNFDDLGTSSIVGSSFDSFYADIAWGPYIRFMSESVYPAYSEPASGNNYVYNFGGDEETTIDFSFLNPYAYLVGASFAKASTVSPEKIRFLGLDENDQVVQQSDWHTLTDTPQFLEANFDPVDKILIERSILGRDYKYSMDDLKYAIIPEPASLGLVVLGSFVFSAGKKRYFDRPRRR